MSLTDHARAARILATALMDRSQDAVGRAEAGGPSQNTHAIAAAVLSQMAMAHEVAAGRMEDQARADIEAIGGACMLDHSRLKGPARCVCGAGAGR